MTDSIKEGVFSYVGTVASLALVLERNRQSLAYELSREAFNLGKLLREYWPLSIPELNESHATI